jgi:glycosyltransferase involved in cell wall biosynthesis
LVLKSRKRNRGNHQTLRILHVSPYFMPARSYGGAVESLYRLCLNLARVGCDVRVLTTNADGPRKVLDVQPGKQVAVAAGFEVTYMGRIARHAVSPALLMRLLTELRRADVVHLTGVYSFTTIPTLLACRLMGKPLVWSPRGALRHWRGSRAGNWGEPLRRLWEIGCRIAAPRGTMLHVTSEIERTESLRRFPNFSVAVIPNAVRVPASIKHSAADGILRLGYIGRLHPQKGIEDLLDACRILKDQGVGYSLVIAGAGRTRYTRSLVRKIVALGLAGVVRMAGEVHGSGKRAFFEALDLLVVPSRVASFASAVAEGLAFALPVIASRNTRGRDWRTEVAGCGSTITRSRWRRRSNACARCRLRKWAGAAVNGCWPNSPGMRPRAGL